MRAAEHTEALRKEAREKAEEAEKLEKLTALFPDLRKQVGRWNKVAFCSKSVNEKVTRFDMRHNCGCCPDSPLEVWPYLETEHGKVYSDPPQFFVGENSYYGDRPRAGWEEELRKAGIPEAIVGAVGIHFRREKESAVEDVMRAFGDEE